MKEPETRWIDLVDSTNNEVRRNFDNMTNLSAIAALEQSAGRGQGNHLWTSEAGCNLTFSMLLRFKERALHVSELQSINDFITSALVQILSEEGVTAHIKRPNDIWVEGKKICGILIENTLDGQYVRKSIIGVGFNLNQTEWPEYLPNPVSLKQLTGKKYPLEAMLERILDCCKKNWSRYFTPPEAL